MFAVNRIRRVGGNTWLLLLVVAVWLAVNVRWLFLYRRRQVLDIDEAGYLGMAYNDHYAAVRDGLEGWVRAVTWPSPQAPFTPAATSLQFFLTGTNVITAFAVPLLAGLATVLLTYGIAHRLGGRRLAWPALVLVATAPRLLLEARAYHFAAPAAAMTTGALYCLVRSERLTRTGWTVGFGIFLGLMPLTRTMTIAFIPPLLLAAVVYASIGPDRRGRLLRLAAALVLAAGVMMFVVPLLHLKNPREASMF